MEKKQTLLRRLKSGLDVPEDILSTQTMVELLGRKRARIVQHKGILEYSDTCIRIMTKIGSIRVTGSGLEIALMNRETIILSGRIDSLDYSGGESE